jgi:hypothetical protein
MRNTPDRVSPVRGVGIEFAGSPRLRRWSRSGRAGLTRLARCTGCAGRARSCLIRGWSCRCRRCSRSVIGGRRVVVARDQESRGRKRRKYFQRLHFCNSYAGEMEMRIPDWRLLTTGDFAQTQRQIAKSHRTGTWSDGFSHPLTLRSIEQLTSRSAACGDRST